MIKLEVSTGECEEGSSYHHSIKLVPGVDAVLQLQDLVAAVHTLYGTEVVTGMSIFMEEE